MRDYGVDGQIGLEATPAAFIASLVAVFDEVRRVVRPDGTAWVNLGDAYSGSGKGPSKNLNAATGGGNPHSMGIKSGHVPKGIPPKNLLLIPERFAIAMQESGWVVRSRICWAKTSALPESVLDRPTSAWEHIWLFSRRGRYFYDAEAVKTQLRHPEATVPAGFGGHKRNGGATYSGNPYDASTLSGANLRNFWLLGPEPLKEAHHAVFPTEIPRRCILAGTRPGDTVLDPFLGSGTTALVADRLGRHAIGIELNPQYVEMARRRIDNDAPMVSEPALVETQGALFDEEGAI